jgi:hypothetical protein
VDEETGDAEQSTADVPDDFLGVKEAETNDDDENDDNHDEDEVIEKNRWMLHNFIIPLKACYQLSGFPHLKRLYWILCILPASSCSAERALSRLRIIKIKETFTFHHM